MVLILVKNTSEASFRNPMSVNLNLSYGRYHASKLNKICLLEYCA